MGTMISYAQNFEDVMLWRALKHVPQGFYIDVGAHDPELHSVTRWFYGQGWTGINVEPSPEVFGRLAEARVRDTNLRVAVSDEPGPADLAIFGETGLATLDDAIADETERAGWPRTDLHVDALTLADLCERHVPKGQAIHFLKIDVEGHERQVLAGADWTRFRPWIVVAEATMPNTPIENHEAWELILVDAGYEFVWFDGLNRFYVAREHADLRAAFKAPPNVFDGFVRIAETGATEHAARADRIQAELEKARRLHATAQAEIERDRDEERRRRESLAADLEAARQENAWLSGALHESRAAREAIVAELVRGPASAPAKAPDTRPLWIRLFFHRSGRPGKVLRKALFHASGRPRGVFRHLVLHPDGRPHAPFRDWMTSSDYRSLRGAIRISDAMIAAGPAAVLSVDARLVQRRVEAMRARAAKQ